MKDYIINAPNLQSFPKRLSSWFVTVLCWVMWGYLLYPVVTVINWMSGDYGVINEMRWFGGYKSLLELLEIYVGTLFSLGLGWIGWIVMRKLRPKTLLPAAKQRVTPNELADFYHVDVEKIRYFNF